jgi:hypothetical protein
MTKKSYKRWTQEEKDHASELLAQFTIKQVSRKLNRSVGSIKEVASNELKDNYCRSKRFRQYEGLLQAHIAKELGVTRSHVNNWIKTNNLPAKKCGKKGFFVINEESFYDWLRQGYILLPMIYPINSKMIDWMCEQRKYFLINFISAQYIKNIACITRGALDNWIRNHSFPMPTHKIGKLGCFYSRKEIVMWAKNNPKLLPPKKISQLASYDNEIEFLNMKMKFRCPL